MIKQCHISKSVHDFPFRRIYGLEEYKEKNEPAIFFGCYDEEDFRAIITHQSLAVIWWCGQDALDFMRWNYFEGSNIHHVTERVNVYHHIKLYGCKLLPVTNIAEKAMPIILGHKIFAYCPASYPEYHGVDVLNELQRRGYDILIGDGSVPQEEWRKGVADAYYHQCFIGLVLSHFAGGGASVIELGLRGIKCVTNVVELGNVINWKTVDDVEAAIKEEQKKIGTICIDVMEQTKKTIDFNNNFLKLSNYGM